jgi:hypothetical protein
MSVSGGYAYVATESGLKIIDLSSPQDPVEVGLYDAEGSCGGHVSVSEGYAYVTTGMGFRVIDVTTPADPVGAGTYEAGGGFSMCFWVEVSDDYAFTTWSDMWGPLSLQVIDVSTPAQPFLVGSCEGWAAALSDGYAYSPYLSVFDVSTPAQPEEVGSYEVDGARDVAMSGRHAYVISDRYLSPRLWVLDVSQPSNPVPVAIRDTSDYPLDVAISGPYVYVAEGGTGLEIFDIRGCPGLWRAPSIRIESPAADQAIPSGSTVSITVENFALDCEHMGQANVEGLGHWALYVDDVLDSVACGSETTLAGAYDDGPHTLAAVLVANDGTALYPAVEDSVEVFIESDVLALGGGRFTVEATWSDFEGKTGVGQAVALTPDTGYFWFFDPANVELVVKVLDGTWFNDHYWVYYGSLSNVEFTLTVTDTSTGNTVTYTNPLGDFGSDGDVRALFVP